MPDAVDFRTLPFGINKVSISGKYIGKSAYWRLYAIENLFRILVHSVLSVQITSNWWEVVIDKDKNKQVQKFKQNYLNQPGATLPGRHDIYYLYLSDLTKIMTSHSNLFIPIIPDVDQWIIRLEQIRLQRNIVGHMNWLSTNDISRIDQTYKDAKKLMREFSRSGMTTLIP
ncbi:MAG: hypothetical protein QY328_04305 [Anaerolineales bacterium]|nr:MAG: hypothetical protein QY328_04305 [Anaerolineales bacterium]